MYVSYEWTHNDTIVEFEIIARNGADFKQNATAFLALVKAFIPASHRSYDPVTKKWEIAKEYWLAIEMAAAKMSPPIILNKKVDIDWGNDVPFQKVHVSEAFKQNFFYEQTPIAPVKDTKTIHQKLELLLGVSITTQSVDELKKIYRRKALELHPDRNNGDSSKMSELNSVWSEYTR